MKPKAFYGNIVLLLVVLTICGIRVQAQNLDSLEQVLKTQKLTHDEQIRICDDLSWGYLNTDFGKSSAYARKGIELAEKDKNIPMVATLYRNLGVAYDIIGKTDSATTCFNQALENAKLINDERIEAAVYGAIANMYNRISLYQEALGYYMKALPLFEKQGNMVRVQLLLGNIGGVYVVLKNYDRALFYCLKAEQLAREQDNTYGIAQATMSLCDIYQAKNEYPQALKCVEQAVDIFKTLDDRYNQAICMQHYAQIYWKGFNDLEKAQEYAENGLRIAKDFDSPNLIAWNMLGLSRVYLAQGRYKECETLTLKALGTDSTDVTLNKEIFGLALRANVKMGNVDAATAYYDRYSDLISAIANKEYQGSLSEMEVKYETEKKELKITALEKEKRLTIWLGISGGAVLLLSLAFFIVRHRLVQQKVARLEQEKQLVATQAVLDGETAERTRLARDLHDGLGGMLSVVKLNLNNVKNGVSIEGEDVARFDRVMNLLDESIRELRRVAHNMMPDSLTRYGLRVSLGDFCGSIPGARFDHYGNDQRLDSKLEVMIYRTVHELVNNALKHANANEIIVQMMQEADRVSVTIQDDGRGFDTTVLSSGAGLNNIRNRVGSYNGHVAIYSEPGKGTEISVEFKL